MALLLSFTNNVISSSEKLVVYCIISQRREVDKADMNKKAYEVKIQELSSELASVSSKLKQFETDANQPSTLLLQISDEMLELKRYHSDALRKEQARANQAEEALKRFSSMEEERIGQLGEILHQSA